MPENTMNTNVVEEQVVDQTANAVVEAVNNNSSLGGIGIGVLIAAGITAAVCFGVNKYKKRKARKAELAAEAEDDYIDADYEEVEDEEDEDR